MVGKHVIFDLDGTLALIDHRRHFVEGKPKDWKSFFEACVDDRPNIPVIYLLHILWEKGYTIVIYSGRSDSVKVQTKSWLAQNNVVYSRIRMRPEGDYTPDEVLKRSWFEEEFQPSDVFCIFDDRQKVVDMWRSLGVSCMQVANGDF